MHLVMRYLCFFGIVKRQGVKRRMDKRSTSEEQLMRELKGKANPDSVRKALAEEIERRR